MTSAKEINISSVKFDQIKKVVSLHQKLLGLTLNNRLGNEHLEYVYKTTVKHKSSKVAIATLNEKIVGHIVIMIFGVYFNAYKLIGREKIKKLK